MLVESYKTKKPLVSILVPLYNAEKTIEEAILSATKQSYQNIEIVVVDDRSTDKSLKIIEGIKDRRIRIIKNNKNLGMVNNWNKCIDVSKGDYFHFLHCDDVLDKNCIERKVKAITNNKNVVMVTSSSTLIDDNSKIIAERKRYHNNKIIDGKTLARKAILIGNIFGEPTNIMYKKSIIDSMNNKFNQSLIYSVDLEFSIRCACYGDVACISDSLNKYRVSSNNVTNSLNIVAILNDDKEMMKIIKNNNVLNISPILYLLHNINYFIRSLARRTFILINNNR